MAFDVKPLLRIAPMLHSAQLVGSVASGYRKKKKRLVGSALGIIVGSSFIAAESDAIESL